MTSLAVYRPLTAPLGRGAALVIPFAFSGVLHEMAITLPVFKGLGLPLLYFFIHGVMVFSERKLEERFTHFARFGRAWTFFWVIAPLPLLFHWDFIRGVIFPLLR